MSLSIKEKIHKNPTTTGSSSSSDPANVPLSCGTPLTPQAQTTLKTAQEKYQEIQREKAQGILDAARRENPMGEALGAALQWLGQGSSENMASVSKTWTDCMGYVEKTWADCMGYVGWKQEKEEEVSDLVLPLRTLIEYVDEKRYPEQKQALQNLLNELIHPEHPQPKSDSAIWNHKVQVKEKIAEILFETIQTPAAEARFSLLIIIEKFLNFIDKEKYPNPFHGMEELRDELKKTDDCDVGRIRGICESLELILQLFPESTLESDAYHLYDKTSLSYDLLNLIILLDAWKKEAQRTSDLILYLENLIEYVDKERHPDQRQALENLFSGFLDPEHLQSKSLSALANDKMQLEEKIAEILLQTFKTAGDWKRIVSLLVIERLLNSIDTERYPDLLEATQLIWSAMITVSDDEEYITKLLESVKASIENIEELHFLLDYINLTLDNFSTDDPRLLTHEELIDCLAAREPQSPDEISFGRITKAIQDGYVEKVLRATTKRNQNEYVKTIEMSIEKWVEMGLLDKAFSLAQEASEPSSSNFIFTFINACISNGHLGTAESTLRLCDKSLNREEITHSTEALSKAYFLRGETEKTPALYQ